MPLATLPIRIKSFRQSHTIWLCDSFYQTDQIVDESDLCNLAGTKLIELSKEKDFTYHMQTFDKFEDEEEDDDGEDEQVGDEFNLTSQGKDTICAGNASSERRAYQYVLPGRRTPCQYFN